MSRSTRPSTAWGRGVPLSGRLPLRPTELLVAGEEGVDLTTGAHTDVGDSVNVDGCPGAVGRRSSGVEGAVLDAIVVVVAQAEPDREVTRERGHGGVVGH